MKNTCADCRQVCPQYADKVVRVETCTSSVQRIVVRCARTFKLECIHLRNTKMYGFLYRLQKA